MSGIEFHPFLESHEIPNSNEKQTSKKEASLKESRKPKPFIRPFDKTWHAAPFDISKITSVKEIETTEKEGTSSEIKNTDSKRKINDTTKIIRPSEFKKIEFINNPILRENQALHIKAEAKAKAQENIRLFKSANIEKITDFLMDDKIVDFEFAKEIEETKKEYASQLADAAFLNQLDWKILTALRLFHKETFEHSIGTYLIAKNKLTRVRALRERILSEGVSLEQFYKSCLFHDIGKMAVFEFILDKKASNLDWVTGLFEMFNYDDDLITDFLADKEIPIPDQFRGNPHDMVEYMEKNRIRAVDFVPAKALFTEDEMQALRKKFPEMDEDATLKDFVAIHENISREMLMKLGLTMEGFLAGNHHNHQNKSDVLGEKSSTLTSLFLSETFGEKELSSTILHLIDMEDALTRKRSYHKPHDLLRTLSFCVDAANQNDIESKTTIIWVLDDLSAIPSEDFEKIRNMEPHSDLTQLQLEQQKNDLQTIEDFLQKHI